MEKGFDYPAVTVGYLCHDGKGNYLLNKRSVRCRDEHGTWDFGGGGMDFGDSVERTLLKELKEEYCVDPIEYSFIGYSDLFRQDKGRPTHWLSMDFLVLVDRDSVRNGEPHKFDQIGWFTLDNLPAPLHSSLLKILKKYGDKLPQ